MFGVNTNGKKLKNAKFLQWTIHIVLLLVNCIEAEHHPAEEDGPLLAVQTAVNLDVNLPCDITPDTSSIDKVQLIIWYKQGVDKPIYTFDARGRSLQQAIPWADEDVLKNKAQFLYETNPPALKIKKVQITDAGLYKCRVDFHKSPTRNWRVNVTVIVPTTKLTIIDSYGATIRDNIAGPYLEGNNISLTCLSSGGIPPPKVWWWKEHALIDDSYQILPDGTVRNVLHLVNMSRADLLSVYTCQASNGHIVAVLSEKVILEMKLPPINILLQGINHPIVAGVRTQITCTSTGARPPPKIIWKKGHVDIQGATQSTSSDGNSTISELVLVPSPEDNGKEVACLVAKTLQTIFDSRSALSYENSYGLKELFLKDSRMLNVTHAPIVSLNLGAPLDASSLMAGSDVYLECSILANPPITRIEWFHNDNKLNSARGILISNQTLVLQSISKHTHGKYFCLATNIQGSVSSNEVYLDVKYSPVCEAETTIIKAALKQTINITCLVDSNPFYDLNYKWYFNNSLNNIIELADPSNGLQDFHNLVSSSLPLKSHAFAEHHSNHHKFYQEHQKHPHHNKRLLEKFVIEKHHQHSKTINGDYENNQFSSVLTPALYHTSNTLKNFKLSSLHISNKSKTENNHQRVDLDDTHLLKNQELSDYKQGKKIENPHAQKLFSNIIYSNRLDKTHRIHNEHIKRPMQENEYRKTESKYYVKKSGTKTSDSLKLFNVYPYYIETYESFGAISCIASNQMGQSQPCWYHIQPADLPDAVKSCIAHNATSSSIQITCTPGYDGGISQNFHIQVYDELNRQILYNITFKHPSFKIKSLPSDSVFVLRITSINLQGSSKHLYRLRARTLSVPLLRTASSTAVLVQLTPLLGAMVGLIVTLTLVVICIAIFIKFRKKHIYRSNGGTIETLDKGGNVELLGRNLGSRLSFEDKNPDVVPLENSDDEFHAEEEAFNRINVDSYRAFCPQTMKRSSPSPSSGSSQTKNKEMSLTTNPAYNICTTPQRIQQPVYTCPPHMLSTNMYERVSNSSTSPFSSLNVCTNPLLGPQQSSHLQSIQVPPHHLTSQKVQFHSTTSENVRFYGYNMSP